MKAGPIPSRPIAAVAAALALVASSATGVVSPALARTASSPAPAAATAAVRPTRGPDSCATTRAELPARARAGEHHVACVHAVSTASAPGGSATDPTSGASAQSIAAPSWCGTDGYLHYTRTDSCGVFTWELNVYDTQTGAVVGQIGFNTINYAYTSSSVDTFAHQLSINPTFMWGAVGGTTVDGYAICASGSACVNVSSNFPSQNVVVGGYQEGDSFFTTTVSAPGSRGYATPAYTFTFHNPGWANASGGQENQLEVRCDNALPGANYIGCVFWQYVPTVSYSLTGSYPVFAKHVQDAQGSGLPGASTPLHRTTDDFIKTQNNNIACPDSYTRPPGDSCDEYPFASTYEGAYLSGGGPRTFLYCAIPLLTQSTGARGYSVCMIPISQNSGAGGVLGGVYKSNQVIDGDAFRVQITT